MKKDIFEFFHGWFWVKIPYYTFWNENAEKTIIISWWMHWNEVNGISLARQIVESLKKNESVITKQRIIIIPILNPTWFSLMQREVAFDWKDPNRAFWREKNKTWSNYRADALSDFFFKNADQVIDIHDAGWRWLLVPHSRMHMCENGTCNTDTRTMAWLLDTKFVLERNWNAHYLAIHCSQKYDIPALTVEVWWEQHILTSKHDEIIKWVHNILIHFWYIEWIIQIKNENQVYSSKRSYLKTAFAWEIYVTADLWSYVSQWDEIWYIYDPLSLEKIPLKAHRDWYIFSKCPLNQIAMWRNVCSIMAR